MPFTLPGCHRDAVVELELAKDGDTVTVVANAPNGESYPIIEFKNGRFHRLPIEDNVPGLRRGPNGVISKGKDRD